MSSFHLLLDIRPTGTFIDANSFVVARAVLPHISIFVAATTAAILLVSEWSAAVYTLAAFTIPN